jgi:hypothetical protein
MQQLIFNMNYSLDVTFNRDQLRDLEMIFEKIQRVIPLGAPRLNSAFIFRGHKTKF